MTLAEDMPQIITESVPGPKTQEFLKKRNENVPAGLCSSTYPICIKRGEGAMFEDIDGNKFLDWVGGVGVLNIGYSRPELVKAVQDQATKYFHTIFNVIGHEGYVELAEGLNETIPCRGEHKKTYFANSGAECDENAIKIAKAYTGRQGVICFSGAFHGRTNLTMALTAKKAYSRGMGPFPADIARAPYPYLYRAPKGYSEAEAIQYYVDGLKKVFDQGIPAKEVACLLVEPLQGEGGFIPAPIEWVKAVRQICDENGILLIADEVQCGNCRTGKYFASEYWAEAGAAPDIVTTAKSLAGGMPISAITGRDEVMDAAPAGTIGGTFCGNALACAAALKVIEVMERDHLADRSLEIGRTVMARYTAMLEKYECVGDVRGLGGMVGIEFVTDKASKTPDAALTAAIIQECARNGLMVESAGTYSNVIRFLAPLVMTDEQLACGLDILERAIQTCSAK